MTLLGFIGLGVMGEAMASNLLAAGHQLVVHDANATRADHLLDAGARWADSARELADQAEVVLTCLRDDSDVEQVMLREVTPAAESGQLFVDLTTSSPAIARQVAAAAAERGAAALDAPVSGGEAGAKSGALVIMVGGEEAAFGRATAILEQLGRPLHVGPAGAGQITKAANQVIVGVTIAGVAEALLLAERAGIDPAAVRAALKGGFADSPVLEVQGQRMLDRAFTPGFRAQLHQKDLRLALDLARQTGTALPTTGVVEQLFTALAGTGDGDRDHSVLQRALRRLNGDVEAGRAP